LLQHKLAEAIVEAKKTKCSDDPAQTWDWIKHKIRETSVNYSKRRSKRRKEERILLDLEYAKTLKEPKPDITKCRARLQKFFQEEDDVIRFRARLEEAEHNEPISPFFFRKILSNRQESHVTSIKTSKYPGGTETREETMDALESHFKETFIEKHDQPRLGDEWFNNIKKISDATRELLDKPIIKNNLTHVIFKEMDHRKSPGADGLSVEFYQRFWVHLVDDLHQSISHGLEKGTLSELQRRSVIRLIAKKGKNETDIKGWRPISLVDIDTKILAKYLANRLKKVCAEDIGREQLAYVNGRVLQDGHLLVGRVLEIAREGKLRGLIATVDFKGAFENIAHQAVWDTLHQMNCGPKLIAHLKTLYSGANSAVLNYGTHTNWF
jgi:hypothetical protein